MNELTPVPAGDDGYAAYEQLLLRRDALRKDAAACQVLYLRAFGTLITQAFAKKVACIEKKKSIAFCQMACSRGEKIDAKAMNSYLCACMAEYQKQLADLRADCETCRNASLVPERTVLAVRELYRRLAKRIHPDLNPALQDKAVFSDLWNRVADAYHSSDLEAMQELEVLVQTALNRETDTPLHIALPDLAARMDRLNREIDTILSTDPYQYGSLLEDPAAVEEKKRQLREEIALYTDYEQQLTAVLQQFLIQGVVLS